MRRLDFPEDIRSLLSRLGDFAASRGTNAYLVGGGVRDFLLGQDLTEFDIDVMIEGDVLEFLESLHECWSEVFTEIPLPDKPKFFPRYQTGKIVLKGHQIKDLDFAGARKETYSGLAAVPEIKAGTLTEDLARRDFTVNALAVSISPKIFGVLIDLYGGIDDLEARELRILHARTFEDDPIRLLRGLKFSYRLGFSFERLSQLLLDSGLRRELLRFVPAYRRLEELKKVFLEPNVFPFLQLLSETKVLDQLFPGAALPEGTEERLSAVELESENSWKYWLKILLSALDEEEFF